MLVMLKMLSLTKENYRTLNEKQVFEQALWLELIRNVKCVGIVCVSNALQSSHINKNQEKDELYCGFQRKKKSMSENFFMLVLSTSTVSVLFPGYNIRFYKILT